MEREAPFRASRQGFTLRLTFPEESVKCKSKLSFARNVLRINLNQNIMSPSTKPDRFSLASLAFVSQKRDTQQAKMFTLHLVRHLAADIFQSFSFTNRHARLPLSSALAT